MALLKGHNICDFRVEEPVFFESALMLVHCGAFYYGQFTPYSRFALLFAQGIRREAYKSRT